MDCAAHAVLDDDCRPAHKHAVVGYALRWEHGAQRFHQQRRPELQDSPAAEGKANPQVRRYRLKASTSHRLAGLTQHRILRNFNVGGAERWEDKAGIGYYGVQPFPASITELDPNRPVYDKAHYYADAFVSYRLKLCANKVGATRQLNARTRGETGRLQPVGAFPNGTPLACRIVDPARCILQLKFDLCGAAQFDGTGQACAGLHGRSSRSTGCRGAA